MIQEINLVGNLRPDLRQERRRARADVQQHAILVWVQFAQQILR